jgi:serine O-acetyltransferase
MLLMDRELLRQQSRDTAEAIIASLEVMPTLAHLGSVFLPSRTDVIAAVELWRQLAFPGFHGPSRITADDGPAHIRDTVSQLADTLFDQVRCCLRYRKGLAADTRTPDCEHCDAEASRIVSEVVAALPAIRQTLATDVQAAFDADPAAANTDETVLSYPGLLAISVQRFAHEFYRRHVPMLPRIMTEHAHSLTGIDIHPGATLGERFFIDHGTGIVIGETTVIGNNVRIYQGVTLGGLSPDRLVEHFRGGRKRHPTIEDNVTLYANATILGGDTTIGANCVIGGNVFLTHSVPPNTLVSLDSPKLSYRQRKPRGSNPTSTDSDFQI